MPVWSRAPSYPRCTDPDDAIQLTDGAHVDPGYIWLDRRCVGWEGTAGSIVTLRFDLGRICGLDSVVVHTAAFARSDVVPPSLVVAAGETANALQWCGALDASKLGADGAAPVARRLLVPLSGARGRILVVAAMLGGGFFFTDEIEVFGTRAEPSVERVFLDAPFGARFPVAELPQAFARQRRVWAMRDALGAFQAVAGSPDEEAGRLQARALVWGGAVGLSSFVRRVDPWSPSTPWSAPAPEIGDTLVLWPLAWGAAAIDIASAARADVRVPVAVLHRPAGVVATLREVVHVEARDGAWVGDALPLARDSLTVRPGEVRRLWIDVQAFEAPSRDRLVVACGAARVEIPIRVQAAAPPARRLGAIDWLYPGISSGTRDAPEAAVRDDVEHGIDSWCLQQASAPWPAPGDFDARGHLVRALDFRACDQALDLHPWREARRLLWYLHFDARLADPSQGRFGFPYLSPAWRRAVREWLAVWLAHLAARGVDTTRVYMMPFDETTLPIVARTFAALPVRLALTVTRNAKDSELRALERHLDLAIVERAALDQHARWIGRAARRGLEVWTYDVPQPAKSTAPMSDWRLLPWDAWARGLAGCGFWAYADNGTQGTAWDDFDGDQPDYAVVYGRAGAPRLLTETYTPSPRWQAFRIGLQEVAWLESAARRDPRLRARVRTLVRRTDAGAAADSLLGVLLSRSTGGP